MANKAHNDSDPNFDAASDEARSGETGRDNRRRVLRNLLSGTGLAAGAHLTSGVWVKPVVQGVTLPAHAQTSAIVLSGLVVQPVVQRSILDKLVATAHAQGTPVSGGCVFLYIAGASITVEHHSNSGAVSAIVGSLAGTDFSVSGIHGVYSISGSLDSASAPTFCSGEISDGSTSIPFEADLNTNACLPVGGPPQFEEENPE